MTRQKKLAIQLQNKIPALSNCHNKQLFFLCFWKMTSNKISFLQKEKQKVALKNQIQVNKNLYIKFQYYSWKKNLIERKINFL